MIPAPPLAALAILTSSPLPSATVGSSYSETIVGSGGSGLYAWSLISASPNFGGWIAGINSTSGALITGTPGNAESESIVIQLTDTVTLGSVQKTFSLQVNSSFVFNPQGINISAAYGGSSSGTMKGEGLPIYKNMVRGSGGFQAPGTPYPGCPVVNNAAGWPMSTFQCYLTDIGSLPWSAGTWYCGFIGNGNETVTVQSGTLANYVPNHSGGYSTFQITGASGGVNLKISGVGTTTTRLYSSGSAVTETVPANATSVLIEVIGAGGASGTGFGGGAGGYSAYTVSVAAGDTMIWTANATGAAGVTGTVTGGSINEQGNAGAAGSSSAGGSGGSGTGGWVNVGGGTGTSSAAGHSTLGTIPSGYGNGGYGGAAQGGAVQFTYTISGYAIQDIFAYLPGYGNISSVIDNPASPSAYTTEGINAHAGFGFIRYMNLLCVLNNTKVMTSSNRWTPSNYQAPNYTSGQGPPWEWCVAHALACNAVSTCNTGMWLNLPGLMDASFSFVTAVANMLFATVPAGIPIYIEIADEMWNGTEIGVAWEAAAAAYGGAGGWPAQPTYFAYQAHNIANIFRSVFGARYGTDVRFVMAWQQGGNGSYWNYNLIGAYAYQGWSIQADFYCNSRAPYINTVSPTLSWSVAQIENNLQNVAVPDMYSVLTEGNIGGMLQFGLPLICYEGGWQTNNENSGLVNGGAAIMDTGMIAVMEAYYQQVANFGAYGIGTFTGGVLTSGGNLAPTDALSTNWVATYGVTNASSPRYAAISSFFNGWTSQRNVVSGSGSVIQGVNYFDNNSTLSAANPTLSGASSSPHYNTQGLKAWMVNCTAPGNYSLVVQFVNSGSAALTGLEYAGNFNPKTTLPATVTIPAGTNSVAVGAVALVAGANYVVLGNPGTNYANVSVSTLTFN